jgi:P27 family predicted phage terminase small subunit
VGGPSTFEPAPLEEMPEAPKALSRRARVVWRERGRDLVRYRILAEVDLDLFRAYCVAVALAEQADEDLRSGAGYAVTREQLIAARTDGEVVSQVIVSPTFKAWREAVQTVRTLAGEFGLTPAIRASVKIPAGDSAKADEADAARLLS